MGGIGFRHKQGLTYKSDNKKTRQSEKQTLTHRVSAERKGHLIIKNFTHICQKFAWIQMVIKKEYSVQGRLSFGLYCPENTATLFLHDI